MGFSRAIVKLRVPILILVLAAMPLCFLGMAGTRINYDMLDYLPGDMDTVTGQNILMDQFGKVLSPSSLWRYEALGCGRA